MKTMEHGIHQGALQRRSDIMYGSADSVSFISSQRIRPKDEKDLALRTWSTVAK